MKLFLLKQIDHKTCDSYDAKLVRAEHEEAARSIASKNAGDEGGDSWILKAYSTVEEITPDNGPAGEIIGSYNAG